MATSLFPDRGGDITTPITLADGGTGAVLVDPGADRMLFWDDSAGAVTWLTAGTGLSITDTTLNASGGGAVWGGITGTLSAQTDLQAALDAKSSLGANVEFDRIRVENGSLAAPSLAYIDSPLLGWFRSEVGGSQVDEAQTLGVPVTPMGVPSVVNNAGAGTLVTAGSHEIYLTYLNATGDESALSPAATIVAPGGEGLLVLPSGVGVNGVTGDFPLGVEGIVVYMTKVGETGSTNAHKVAEFSVRDFLPTGGAEIDIADGSLTGAAPPLVPTFLSAPLYFNNGLLINDPGGTGEPFHLIKKGFDYDGYACPRIGDTSFGFVDFNFYNESAIVPYPHDTISLGIDEQQFKNALFTGTVKAALQTNANATTGLVAGTLAALTNASIVITDGTGQVYRVPCII